MDIYVDPDTGEELTEDQVDWNQYEPDIGISDQIVEESRRQNVQPSMRQAIQAGIARTPLFVTRGVAGGIKGLQELFTGEDVDSGFAQDLLNYSDSYEKGLNTITNIGNATPGSAESIASNVTTGVSTVGLGLPAMLATGALGSAGMFGALGAGDEYGRLRTQGVERGPAGRAATVIGGVDAAANALPFWRLMKSGTPLLRRMIESGLANSLTSGLSTGARLETEDAVGLETTPEEKAAQYQDALITGGLTGALSAPIFHSPANASRSPKANEAAIADFEAKMSGTMPKPTPDIPVSDLDSFLPQEQFKQPVSDLDSFLPKEPQAPSTIGVENVSSVNTLPPKIRSAALAMDGDTTFETQRPLSTNSDIAASDSGLNDLSVNPNPFSLSEKNTNADLLVSRSLNSPKGANLSVDDIISDPSFLSRYESTIKQTPYLEDLMTKLSQEFGGKAVVDQKELETAAAKIIRKREFDEKPDYSPEDLGDIIRSRLVLDDVNKIPNVEKWIAENTKVIPDSVENYYLRPTPLGFESLNLNAELPDGGKFEIQIQDKVSAALGKIAHDKYEELRATGKLNDFAEVRKARKALAIEELRLLGEIPEPVTSVDSPVMAVKREEIATLPDLMQFKKSDDSKTGVNETDRLGKRGEKYDPLKAGVLLLWEPKNPADFGLAPGQKYVVANGHHRFEFGSKQDVSSFNAQVVREADGVSAQMARTLAAEINIADGKGSLADQIKFLEGTAATFGEAAARARALETGPRGSRAATIAFDGSADLKTALYQEDIKPDFAEGIALGAPLDPDVQATGIDAAINGYPSTDGKKRTMPKSGGELEKFLRVFRETMPKPNETTSQVDMFGRTDAASRHAVDVAKALGEFERTLKWQRQVIEKPSKNLGEAKKLGVEVDDPTEAARRLNEINKKLDELSRYATNKDIQNEALAFVQKKPSTPKPKKGIIKDETGSAPILADIGKAVRSALDPDYVPPELQTGDNPVNIKGTSEAQKFFEGRVGEIKAPIFSDALKWTRQNFTFPKTIADKFGGGAKVAFDTAMDVQENTFRTAKNLTEEAKPYFNLSDKTKVNQALEAARRQGNKFIPTPESLAAMGLSPEESSAFLAVRKTMDSSLAVLREALIARGKKIDIPEKQAKYAENVDAFIEKLKGQNYVPFSRFGDYFVAAKTPDGEMVSYTLHENKKDYVAALQEARKQGYKVEGGKVQKPAREAYESMPPNLLRAIGEIDEKGNISEGGKSGLPPQGFKAHLTQAKLTAGQEQNFDRAISDYIVGLSSFAANADAQPKYNEALSMIDPRANAGLYKFTSDYIDRMGAGSPGGGAFRKALATYYLGGNIKSAALNLTQGLTMTYPLLSRHVNNAEVVMTKSYAKAGRYLASPESFAKADPELAAALKVAVDDGTTSEKNFRELTAKSRTGKPQKTTASDALFLFFGAAEKANRLQSFIAGYEAARQNGIDPTQRIDFAKNFVTETQFEYSKANRPALASGPVGSTALMFKMFPGNWLRAFRNTIGEGQYQATVRMVGGMLVLGGATAMPMIKPIMQAMEAAGVDPKAEAREFINNKTLTDILLYGLPTYTGMNISGAVGLGDLGTGMEQGIAPAILKTVMGVAVDPLNRVQASRALAEKGHEYIDSDGLLGLGRASEPLQPEFLRNMSAAYRASKEGFRDARGRPLVKDPTTSELLMKGAGFTPQRLARAYEDMHSRDVLEKRVESTGKNLNLRLALAIKENDGQKLRAIVEEIRQHNEKAPPEEQIVPNQASIEKMLLDMAAPEAAWLMRLPNKAKAAGLELLQSQQADR